MVFYYYVWCLLSWYNFAVSSYTTLQSLDISSSSRSSHWKAVLVVIRKPCFVSSCSSWQTSCMALPKPLSQTPSLSRYRWVEQPIKIWMTIEKSVLHQFANNDHLQGHVIVPKFMSLETIGTQIRELADSMPSLIARASVTLLGCSGYHDALLMVMTWHLAWFANRR